MKNLIIYTSQTGFTKRYAEWLAEKMNADMFDLKDVQKKDGSFFEEYETITYAGWAMAGSVVKVKWFLDKAVAWEKKRLAIIVVGGSPNDNPDVEVMLQRLLTDEQRNYIKAFYCQGGINYDKMKAPSRMLMKVFVSAMKKQKDEKSRLMGEYLAQSYDISDIKYLDSVVAYLQGETVL